MTCTKPIFNPLKLNSKPVAIVDVTVVFARECPLGDPRLVADQMLCKTKSEFQLLGRMYDKQFVQRLDIGGTPSFFGTQQSYLNMLVNRGLVEPIARQRNRYQLTQHGKRIYELNYWIDMWKREQRQSKQLDNSQERVIRDLRGAWVNPKPETEPNAVPQQPIPTDDSSTDDGPALPPGVYPAL